MYGKWLAAALIGLIAAPAATRPAARLTEVAAPSVVRLASDQGPRADLIAWRAIANADGSVDAVLTSSVESMAPYFESARLERDDGITRTQCGQFAAPRLADTGVNRLWIYPLAQRPAGPCAAGRGVLVAVGVRGAAETRSEPAR